MVGEVKEKKGEKGRWGMGVIMRGGGRKGGEEQRQVGGDRGGWGGVEGAEGFREGWSEVGGGN